MNYIFATQIGDKKMEQTALMCVLNVWNKIGTIKLSQGGFDMFSKHIAKYTKIVIAIVLAIVLTMQIIGCAADDNLDEVAKNEPPEMDAQTSAQINERVHELTNGQTMYPLIFNTPEVTANLEISFNPPDFFLDATAEQLRVALPTLDFDMLGTVSYNSDGTFVNVNTHVSDPNPYVFGARISIWVGEDFRITSDFMFDDDFVPEYSYVYEIPVIALMIHEGWGDELFFRASFEIDGIQFHIRLSEGDSNAGQMLLTEIVNNLILGGTDGLAVFDNPVIPELRSESITLEEALNDADFGGFVPTYIPDGFINQHGVHRWVQGHLDVNTMFMEWQSSFDYDYLYGIYAEWVEARTYDVFAFDDIFWGWPSVRWTVTDIDERDFERIVSADDYRLFDWSLYPQSEWQDDDWNLPRRDIPWEYFATMHDPIFRADEITLDIVRIREEMRYIPIHGADGAISENPADILFPLLRNYIMFGVLFDDGVLINISAEGMTYEQIWEMLTSIGENTVLIRGYR